MSDLNTHVSRDDTADTGPRHREAPARRPRPPAFIRHMIRWFAVPIILAWRSSPSW